jgi:hypothetical protein
MMAGEGFLRSDNHFDIYIMETNKFIISNYDFCVIDELNISCGICSNQIGKQKTIPHGIKSFCN